MDGNAYCPTCRADGTPCTIEVRARRRTLMGWSGGPDPNWHTTDYICSNGHVFDVVRKHGESDRLRPNSKYWGVTYSPPDEIILSPGGTDGA